MVEELTRKLNQEHAELSKEELLLIPALNRLKQLFIKAVLENRVTFKSLLPNVQEYIDMIPDEEDKKSFAIQVDIIQAPMMGIFDIKQTGFDENIIGMKQDEFAEIIRKSGERIADPNYIKPEDLSLLFYIGKSIEYDEVVINKLLDYKRYDIIKAYKNPINISDETCERIVKEFPFKEYGCPIIVTDYLKRQKKVDLLSFESLSGKTQIMPSRFFTASSEDDTFDIILTKIKQSSLEELEENYKYIDITNYDNEKQEELIQAIMKKGYVIPISDSISQNDNIRKEYFKNIYSCLKNKIEIDPNIITEHIDKIIKEDEKLYKEIISSKYAIYLPKEIWENVQFDEINFENEKIEFGEANIEKLFELPDHIFYKIINTARPQQADNFDFSKLDLQNENVKNKVIALLNSKIRTNRIQLPFGFSPKEQREIVETIMNNQYLKSLDMLQMGRNEILLENEDLAIKYIRENPAELSDIIRSNINRIMNNEKILDEIVSNEIGIGFLLKELEHVTEIHYTHKLYEKVKNFLTSEYDVELAKLDKLESLVGPLIIKYVKNENIKAVLKLSDEEIEKIIALFPEVIYTVDDAKAAYESIIQYSYATSMPQSHNIFASILHASEEGDLAKINELKCNIMWLMTKEEFIKIGTGESVKEYLDRLLRKENIRENLNEIHEITNKYVELSRKYYRNNNMFFHKSEELDMEDGTYYIAKEHFIRYDELIREICDPKKIENITLLDQFIAENGDELLPEIREKFGLEEYSRATVENFIDTLCMHINESINGSEEYSLENNINILKFIVEKYNEEFTIKKSFEEQFELPYRLEKPAFRRGLDKKIISNYQNYQMGEIGLDKILIERFADQGINKFVLDSAIRVYSTGRMPFSEEGLRQSINITLSKKKIINLKTNEIIENCTVDYLLEHIEDLDNIALEEQNAFFIDWGNHSVTGIRKSLDEVRYENNYGFRNFGFASDNVGSLKDVILAIKNKQTSEEYLKSIIGKVVKEYKSIVKDPNDLTDKNTQKTPMELCYDELFRGDTYVRDGGQTLPIREYMEAKLAEKGFAREEMLRIPNKNSSPIMAEFYKIMKDCYEKDMLYYVNIPTYSFINFIEESAAKRHHIVLQSNEIIQIITESNIDLIAETILPDEETYNLLIEILRKRKVHVTPEVLSREMEDLALPVECSPSTIAGFISYFATIKEKHEDVADMTFIKIIVQGEIYNGISVIYKQILGPADAKLIKANPRENAADRKTTNDQRLKESVEQTIKNFQRQKVTIPTFDENISIGSKRINVVVGNFTDPCNLTHGERTGACMRIGGAGEKLYDFALNNENGFHIRFEDPVTHEYVSRVTGFRNGNTVFLNQLRHSCSKRYNSNDVIEACKKVAEMLIEKSKDSPCPIENVIIHKSLVLKETPYEKIEFKDKDIKEGLPGFYSDIEKDGIVLATTATEGPLKEMDFDKSQVPTYLPQRGKITESDRLENIQDRIIRVASVKKVLGGTPYDEIGEFEFESGFIYGKASDDWYIYIDSNNVMYYDYIDIDPRAKKELMEEVEKIKEIIQTTTPEKEEVIENVK